MTCLSALSVSRFPEWAWEAAFVSCSLGWGVQAYKTSQRLHKQVNKALEASALR